MFSFVQCQTIRYRKGAQKAKLKYRKNTPFYESMQNPFIKCDYLCASEIEKLAERNDQQIQQNLRYKKRVIQNKRSSLPIGNPIANYSRVAREISQREKIANRKIVG
jgi:hypothetical protein